MTNNPYQSPVEWEDSEHSIRSDSGSRQIDWLSVSFVVAISAAYFALHYYSRDVQEVAKDGFEGLVVDWLPLGVAQDRFWFTLLGIAFSASLVLLLRRAARIKTPTAVIGFMFNNWIWLLIFLTSLVESWLLATQALSD